MAWRRSGDKTLSEQMMVRLPTHICVTRPQWVKWRYSSWMDAKRWTTWPRIDSWHVTSPNLTCTVCYCWSVTILHFCCDCWGYPNNTVSTLWCMKLSVKRPVLMFCRLRGRLPSRSVLSACMICTVPGYSAIMVQADSTDTLWPTTSGLFY